MGKIMKNIILVICLVFVSSVNASDDKLYVEVNGLVCDFCARAVEKVFLKQEGVSDIDVNLKDKLLTIDLHDGAVLEDALVEKLVNDAGYSMVEVRNSAEPNNE